MPRLVGRYRAAAVSWCSLSLVRRVSRWTRNKSLAGMCKHPPRGGAVWLGQGRIIQSDGVGCGSYGVWFGSLLGIVSLC